MGKITDAAVRATVCGYIPSEARSDDTDAGMAQPLARIADAIGEKVLSFEERAREIEDNSKLSPEGKADQLRDAFVETVEGLGDKELGERTELAHKEIERLRQMPPPPSSDDPHAIAVAGDIRRHLADMTMQDRLRFLQENAGDPQVVAAVLNAPRYLSGMSDTEVKAFERMALQALHPERVERVELLERTIEGARKARANAERMLTERAGVKYSRKDGRWLHRLEKPGARPVHPIMSKSGRKPIVPPRIQG